MTDTEREAVARALAISDGFDPDEPHGEDALAWHAYQDNADAAIAALDAHRAGRMNRPTLNEVEELADELWDVAVTITEHWPMPIARHVLARITGAVAAERRRCFDAAKALMQTQGCLNIVESRLSRHNTLDPNSAGYWEKEEKLRAEHDEALQNYAWAEMAWTKIEAAAAIRAGAPVDE